MEENTSLIPYSSEFTPLYVQRTWGGGMQVVFRFDNARGASCVLHGFSYGHECNTWELAVLRFTDSPAINDFKLDYSTPITSDVIGYLEPDAIPPILRAVRAMPPPQPGESLGRSVPTEEPLALLKSMLEMFGLV